MGSSHMFPPKEEVSISRKQERIVETPICFGKGFSHAGPMIVANGIYFILNHLYLKIRED